MTYIHVGIPIHAELPFCWTTRSNGISSTLSGLTGLTVEAIVTVEVDVHDADFEEGLFLEKLMVFERWGAYQKMSKRKITI